MYISNLYIYSMVYLVACYIAVQKQKAVSAHFTSEQILYFAFVEQHTCLHYNNGIISDAYCCTLNTDIAPMLVCCCTTVCDAGSTINQNQIYLRVELVLICFAHPKGGICLLVR